MSTSKTTKSDLLSAREAAQFLAVHVQTYRRLAKQGKIPAVMIGGSWKSSRKALRDFVSGERASA